MNLSGKRPSRIPAIGTVFIACSFLATQFLAAIVFLNRQQPSQGDFLVIFAAIDAAFLILLFTVAMTKKRRERTRRNESGEAAGEGPFGGYAEIQDTLRNDFLPRLEALGGSLFERRDLESLEDAAVSAPERPVSGLAAAGSDSIAASDTGLRLIRGLVGIGSRCIDLIREADSERASMKESMASMNAAIGATLPIVEKIILATEEYEADVASQIFEKFEEIWEYSKKLVGDSEKTLQIFSKGEGGEEEGLAYIATKNKEISTLFGDFTEVVEKLEKTAHSFLESSIDGLEEIRRTIGGIEDMAERIKIISINVRIEAARESGKNSGFKVLGQEITSFAEQTSIFSNKTVTEIEETIGNLKPLRDELLGNLNRVQEGMESVENKLSPYNRIIDRGFVQMDAVTKNLNEISVNILNKMKQTIGNLQYQDITNQEAMHIIEILANMKGECALRADRFVEEADRDSERDHQVLEEVLKAVKSIITTGTEQEILDGFLEAAGLDADDENDHILADSTNLDDKTILF